MKFANLLVSCACLLLLQLEMGASRATVSGPSESLYATAWRLGLDAAGLDEIWRTGQPLVITKPGEAGEQTRVTYELSPDRTALSMYKITQKSSSAKIEASATTPSNSFGSGLLHSSLFSNWGLPGVTPRGNTNVHFVGPYFSEVPKEPVRIPVQDPTSTQRGVPFIGLSLSKEPRFLARIPVQERTSTQSAVNLLPTVLPTSGAGTDSTIDDFLAKVNISKIEEKNGESDGTIVDKNGRVATVTGSWRIQRSESLSYN